MLVYTNSFYIICQTTKILLDVEKLGQENGELLVSVSLFYDLTFAIPSTDHRSTAALTIFYPSQTALLLPMSRRPDYFDTMADRDGHSDAAMVTAAEQRSVTADRVSGDFASPSGSRLNSWRKTVER